MQTNLRPALPPERGFIAFCATTSVMVSAKRNTKRKIQMEHTPRVSASQPIKKLLSCCSRFLEELLNSLGNSATLLLIAEGASYEEAALQLGVKCGTVKSRVCRARHFLARYTH